MSTDAAWREAQRQQALIAALWAPAAEPAAMPGWQLDNERARRGLAAYRANAGAIAHRALQAAFPRLERMLGDEALPALARAFSREHPPERGDLGTWGEALPAWLAAQPSLAEWPWLADAARLDWAVHQAERATDEALDAESLSLLSSRDPGDLVVDLCAGTAVLASAWPVVDLHHAHASGAADEALAAARAAVAAGAAQTALVWRRGWRAEVAPIDPAGGAFTTALLGGARLGAALAQAGEALDFGGWLARAVGDAWLKCVRPAND